MCCLKPASFKTDSSDREESLKKAERARWEAQQEEDVKEELARRNRGEEMKRKRSEEARQLIQSQRSQEARAVFEKHTAYGQMKNSRPPAAASSGSNSSLPSTSSVSSSNGDSSGHRRSSPSQKPPAASLSNSNTRYVAHTVICSRTYPRLPGYF